MRMLWLALTVAACAAGGSQPSASVAAALAEPVVSAPATVPTASTAVRGQREQLVPLPQDPQCAPSRSVPTAAKVVVNVVSSGVNAAVQLLRRDGDRWVCEGTVMDGRVGRTGVHELAVRVGGDGSTPGGVFGLGTMTAPNGDVFQFFGNGSNPGVTGGWHQVQPDDCWWADPGTSAYNTLVTKVAASCRGENEYLPNYVQAYSRAALIDANMGPSRVGDEPGETPRAAAIFLHRHVYTAGGLAKPTSGCVSLSEADLAFVLTWLVPGEAWFVIS